MKNILRFCLICALVAALLSGIASCALAAEQTDSPFVQDSATEPAQSQSEDGEKTDADDQDDGDENKDDNKDDKDDNKDDGKDKPTGKTRYAKKSVKMYKSRKTSSKVLKTIPKDGEVYEVSTRGKWSKIQFGGKTGFVKKSKLTDTMPTVITEELGQQSIVEEGADDGTGMRDLDTSKRKAGNWAGQIVLGIGGMPIPQLFQFDYPETVCVYGGHARSVQTSGCGATSLSMIIAYLTDNWEQSPYTLFRDACQDGMYHGAGLGHEDLLQLGKRYGVTGVWQKLGKAELIKTLRSGTPIIAHMGEGLFTEGGHYIVLRGVTDDDGILINDPASAQRSKMAYPVDVFMKESKSSEPFMVCTLDDNEKPEQSSASVSVRIKANQETKGSGVIGPTEQNV